MKRDKLVSLEVCKHGPDELIDIDEIPEMLEWFDTPNSQEISGVVIPSMQHDVVRTRSGQWPELTDEAKTVQSLGVYEMCRAMNSYNMLGPCIPLSTCNNIDAWKRYSMGHDDDEWLIQCINFGFPFQYSGPPLYNPVAPNHPSARDFPQQVENYIQKELSLGAIVGPFSSPPFTPWCNVAPLMSREKTNSTDRRIIVDLSYPPDNNPNAYILKNSVFGQEITHCLPSVQDATSIIIDMGFRVTLASLDISRAYRNFPTEPYDWPLNCIQFREQFYIDLCMPFGSRISSLYMQRMAELIRRALRAVDITCVIYLDDALVITPKSRDADSDFAVARGVIRDLGLPIAWEKIINPCTRLRFLGIIIDVEKREISIPSEKITSFIQFISEVATKRVITKKTLQRLIGHINHMGKAVAPARLFMNRLLCALREQRTRFIRMDGNLLSDIEWFRVFLSEYNGRSLIVEDAPHRTVEADSCLTAGGGCMGSLCYHYLYPPEQAATMHISQLEAWNCLIAARVFLSDAYDECVMICCDNEAAVSSLSSGRARDNVLLAVARAFWFFAARRNLKFIFTHVPGVSMTTADALSRQHISENSAAKAAGIVQEKSLEYVDVSHGLCDISAFF